MGSVTPAFTIEHTEQHDDDATSSVISFEDHADVVLDLSAADVNDDDVPIKRLQPSPLPFKLHASFGSSSSGVLSMTPVQRSLRMYNHKVIIY